jgi:hypothetical protein
MLSFSENTVRSTDRAASILEAFLSKPWLVSLVLFLVAFAPRAVAAGAYVTVDEEHWVSRSVDFVYGLLHGDLAVVPSVHPGVTALWGFGALLFARFYLAGDVSPLLQMRAEGAYDMPGLLPTAAMFTVLVASVTVVASFLLLRRLLGSKTALLAALFVALDPILLAHSRRVHLDAILTSVMFLSAVALLSYAGQPSTLSPRRYLVVSGIFAGLALLTKVASVYLIPFAMLVLVMRWLIPAAGRQVDRAGLWREAKGFLLWLVVALLVFVALWPAMWVSPGFALGELVRGVSWALENPHGAPGATGAVPMQFFMGEVVDDPGIGYYPLVSLFRLSPIVFLALPAGIAVAILGLRKRVRQRSMPLVLVLGIAYVVFFVTMMSLGTKKLESYILPVFPMVDTLAAMGLMAVLRWLARPGWAGGESEQPSNVRPVPYALSIAGIIGVSVLWLRLQPYYSSYFNPLLGGIQTASRIFAFGGGEGLDMAADYLNQKEGAESLVVSTPYDQAVFAYYFDGIAEPPRRKHWTGSWLVSDYVIGYRSYWQRNIPSIEAVEYLETLEPEYVARINGVDYARVYQVPPLVTSSTVQVSRATEANLEDQVTLLGYDLRTDQVESGGAIEVTLYWQRLQPLQSDYSISLRLINGVYDAWGTQDSGPLWGMMPTSLWDEEMVIADVHRLPVLPGTPPGTYLIEVGMYDSTTMGYLEVVGEQRELLLGPVEIARGLQTDLPIPQHDHEANLDDQIRLFGYDLEGQFRPGEGIHLTLFWEALLPPREDYTVFVHLTGRDGKIWAQQDNQPVTGYYPTSGWVAKECVRDQYHLTISEEAPPGPYTLKLGMYEAGTSQRLPVLDKTGKLVGDSIILGVFEAELP